MLQPTNVTIDGISFQLTPLPVLKAIRVEKRLATLLAPVLAGLGNLDPKAQVDMKAIGDGLFRALQSTDDDAFLATIRELLGSVTYLPNGAAPMALTDEMAIDAAFTGRIVTMYKLAVEVMKFNKFSFFALAGSIGKLMPQIATLQAHGLQPAGTGGQSAA